jgi:predicted Zn-dependent protease
MRMYVAVLLLLCGNAGMAQVPLSPDRSLQNHAAYPESEATAAWRSLAASYVRKAIKERKLDRDPVLNARVDAVMAAVGTAVAAIDSRFTSSSWRAILIEDFGRGAAAFPGETILVDSKFVRYLALSNDELALILSHEAAHVIAGHASAKLSFMAEYLGKEKIPTAHTALVEFMARDSYAEVFLPQMRAQEQEADRLGAIIFFATGYDARRALALFDKLSLQEARQDLPPGRLVDSHDAALVRKQAVSTVIAELRELHVLKHDQ